MRVEWRTVSELLKPAGLLFLSRGGATLVRQSDNLLIGMVMDARAVLIFALTKRAFDALSMLAGHFVGAFMPALAHLFGEVKEQVARARRITDLLIHVTVALGLVLMGGYVILNQTFMGLWVGSQFYAGDLVVGLIGLYGLLYVQSLAFYNVVFARGRLQLAALANGLEALLRLILVIMFSRWWGLPGAALAGVLSLACTGWWLLALQYQRDFPVTFPEMGRSLGSMAFLIAGLAGLGVTFWSLSLAPSLGGFVAQAAAYLAGAFLWTILVDHKIREVLLAVLRRRSLDSLAPCSQ